MNDVAKCPAGDSPKLVTTRIGLRLRIRPAQLGDRAALAQFFQNVTRDDLRFRFLSAIREVSSERLDELLNVDHERIEDLLAFDEEGQIAGSAMIAIDQTRDNAEVAIVIRRDLKGRGIGWSLLEQAAAYARQKGVKVLRSIESRANYAAIAVERDMGFTVTAVPEDPTLVVVRKALV